jgi:hypothetical protein
MKLSSATMRTCRYFEEARATGSNAAPTDGPRRWRRTQPIKVPISSLYWPAYGDRFPKISAQGSGDVVRETWLRLNGGLELGAGLVQVDRVPQRGRVEHDASTATAAPSSTRTSRPSNPMAGP